MKDGVENQGQFSVGTEKQAEILAVNLREFLSADFLQLPIKRDQDDFRQFVRDRLKTFQNNLSKLEAPDSISSWISSKRDAIEKFIVAVPEIIDAIFSGRPYQAFAKFSEKIEPFQNELGLNQVVLFTQDQLFLYRVRRDLLRESKETDLFHIPFELRHKVGTSRFSLPGLPCLYLSGSVYTCWAEMGMPPLHELTVAGLWVPSDRHVIVLDLSRRPKHLLTLLTEDGVRAKLRSDENAIAEHIISWPLMALCYLVVKHRDAPFKPEYIFPQLLLQWITVKRPCDGIRYFSTHVNSVSPERPIATCNFVFPARHIAPKGYCVHLAELFRMTKPYGWQLLSSTLSNASGLGKDFDFEFIEGYEQSYGLTEFGRVESAVNFLGKQLRFSSEGDQGRIC